MLRKPVSAPGTFLNENLAALKGIGEFIAPGEPNSWDELKPGEGAIVRKGLRKIAAYRDAQGKMLLRSAACSHLGCHVHWNSFENCWDCPCQSRHGEIAATD